MQKFLDKIGLERFWQHIKSYIDKNVGSGSGGIVQWEDIQGRPDLSDVSRMKSQPIVLSKDLWLDNEQGVACLGVTKDPKQQLIVTIPDTADEDAYFEANIRPVEQQIDGIFFKCEETPDRDIVVYVFIFEAAEIGEEYTGEFVWWSPKMTSNITPEPFVASASSYYIPDNTQPYLAFDGKNEAGLQDCWSCAMGDSNAWLQFDFGGLSIIKGVRIHPRGYFPGQFPKTIYIDVSFNGEKWETIHRETDMPPQTEFKKWVVTAELKEPITTRYVRFSHLSDGGFYRENLTSIGGIEFLKLEATQ